MKKSIIFLILLFLITYCNAQEYRYTKIESLQCDKYFSSLFNNPATKYYKYRYSYWEINSGFDISEKNRLVQNADKSENYLFTTNSYIKNKKVLYYGSLNYRTSKDENVGWLKSSDYEYLYPYVLFNKGNIDLNSEEYMFSGGYSNILGKNRIGIFGKYRAMYEFGKKDPRPRNIISQYSLNLGISRQIINHYILGFSFNIDIYNQANILKVFREGDKVKMYFMKGFGYYDRIFSMMFRNFTIYHDMQTYTLSLQLFKHNLKGYFALINYKHINLNHDLSLNQDINLANQSRNSFDISFGKRISDNFVSKLLVNYLKHKNTENVYESIGSGQYRKITSYSNMDIMSYRLINSNMYSSINQKFNLILDLGFYKYKEEYKITNDYINISTGILNISSLIKFKNLSLEALLGYSRNLKSKYQFVDHSKMEDIKAKVLEPNYNYLSSNKYKMGLNVIYKYRINEKYQLALSLKSKVEKSSIYNLSHQSIFKIVIIF